MSFISLIIFVLLLVAGSLANDGNTTLSCFSVERNALLKFKASFSDPSRKLSSWNSTNMDCCNWRGVQCDKVTGHVIAVELRNEENYATSLQSDRLDSSIMKLKHLRILDLSGNYFELGYIPASIGTLNQLQYLNLSHANFGGLVSRLSSQSRLRVLDLRQMGLDNLSALTRLALSYTKLNGSIPSCFGNLTSLRILDLSYNQLSGEIPTSLGQLQNLEFLRKFQRLYGNILAGSIPSCFGNLTSLRELDLSYNQLSGPIPTSICNLSALTTLDLSHNKLNGSIPSCFGNLKLLESLDLSNNNLFESIPASLSELDSLGFLNLSHNNLSGEIPTWRHLQTLDNPWNYEGNPGLCGAPLSKKCNVDKSRGTPSEELSQPDEEDKIDRIWFCGVVISGFATGFWGVIGVLLFKRGWRFAYFRFADDIIGRICG